MILRKGVLPYTEEENTTASKTWQKIIHKAHKNSILCFFFLLVHLLGHSSKIVIPEIKTGSQSIIRIIVYICHKITDFFGCFRRKIYIIISTISLFFNSYFNGFFFFEIWVSFWKVSSCTFTAIVVLRHFGTKKMPLLYLFEFDEFHRQEHVNK